MLHSMPNRQSIYLSRPNTLDPTTFKEAIVAAIKLFPDKIIAYYETGTTYNVKKVTESEMTFVVIDGTTANFRVGQGVVNEINHSELVFILYKRVMDGAWQIYDYNGIAPPSPRMKSATNRGDIRLGENITQQMRETEAKYQEPIKPADVLVDTDKPRNRVLLVIK